ncbi:MAG: hypothetical protein MUC96_01770 [Myxococcaceae bacterium]|jgi:hypothetical protein|nr:hypothetical protein [Myxococcaceae bacterium]
MTTTQRVALATAAGALLAAGFWLLRPEETAPPTAPPSGAAPVPSAVVAPPAPRAEVAEAATPTPAADAGTSAAAAEPTAPSGPTVEVAPSPFTDANSEELRYAVKLVLGPDTGPTEWRKAAEVFQRCVDVNPTNHLCKRGVYAAYERLDSDGGPATTLTPPRELQPASAGPTRPEVERLRNENLLPVSPR